MATQQQIFETKVMLNTEQALNQIKKLQKETELLKERKDKAFERGDMTTWKALGKEIEKNEKQMARLQTRQQGINSTLSNMSTAKPKELRQTIKSINELLNSGAIERGSAQWKSLQATLGDVKGELSKIKAESEATGGEKSGIFGNLMGKVSNLPIMNQVRNIGQAFLGLKAMIATSIAAIKGAIDGARWFVDYNKQIEEANRLTREFIGLTGSALQQTRSDIQATADVMGKDYKEVLSAVDALMSQYQLTAEEAISIVNDGFQSGADLSGKFLSQLQQYAPTFHDAGISASELVAMIQQTRSGIFSADGMNVIQMGSKRIREMSDATAKALDGIGISSEHVKEQLRDGTQTTFDVIRDISSHLRQFPNDAEEVGAVLKDVFGRQGANAGIQLIEQLDTMDTDLNRLKNTTGEYGELQRQQIETQSELNRKMAETFGIGEGGFTELTLKAKVFCLEALIAIIDYCKDIYNEIGVIRVAIEAVRIAFDTAFKLIEAGFDFIVDSVRLVALELKGLAQLIEGVFTFDIDKAQAGFDQVVGGFKDFGNRVVDQAKDIGTRWGNNLVDSGKRVLNNRKGELAIDGNTLPEVTISANRSTTRTKTQTTTKTDNNSKTSATNQLDKELKERENKIKLANERELMNNVIMYRRGERDYRTYIAEQNRITADGIRQRMAVYEELGETDRAEYLALIKVQSDEENRIREQNITADLNRLQRESLMKKAIARAAFTDETSEMYGNEEMLNERLFEIDMDFMQQRLAALSAMNREGTEEYLNLQTQMETTEMEHRAERERDYLDRLQRYREQFLRMGNEQQLQIAMQGLEDLHRRQLLSEEEYQRMKLAIQAQYAQNPTERRNEEFDAKVNDAITLAQARATGGYDKSQGMSLANNPIMGEVAQYRSVMQQLQTMREQDQINHQEYEQAKAQVTSEFLANMVSQVQAAYESVNQVMQAASSYYAAQSQYEQAVTTRKYDREIEAAGNNEKRRKKIEEQKQKELAKIKTKYNKKAMKIEIAQAFASTAMAAINSYASASKEHWLLGAVAAAMATAAGMMQIATIKKQHAAEEAGYYEGGFTGGSNWRKRAGVVHEGEFVVNHDGVANPNLLPILRAIDVAQRNNTIGRITPVDIGMGNGGTNVVTPIVNVNNDNSELDRSISSMNETISRLNDTLAKGINADVYLDGPDGLAAKQKRFEQLTK